MEESLNMFLAHWHSSLPTDSNHDFAEFLLLKMLTSVFISTLENSFQQTQSQIYAQAI